MAEKGAVAHASLNCLIIRLILKMAVALSVRTMCNSHFLIRIKIIDLYPLATKINNCSSLNFLIEENFTDSRNKMRLLDE